MPQEDAKRKFVMLSCRMIGLQTSINDRGIRHEAAFFGRYVSDIDAREAQWFTEEDSERLLSVQHYPSGPNQRFS